MHSLDAHERSSVVRAVFRELCEDRWGVVLPEESISVVAGELAGALEGVLEGLEELPDPGDLTALAEVLSEFSQIAGRQGSALIGGGGGCFGGVRGEPYRPGPADCEELRRLVRDPESSEAALVEQAARARSASQELARLLLCHPSYTLEAGCALALATRGVGEGLPGVRAELLAVAPVLRGAGEPEALAVGLANSWEQGRTPTEQVEAARALAESVRAALTS